MNESILTDAQIEAHLRQNHKPSERLAVRSDHARFHGVVMQLMGCFRRGFNGRGNKGWRPKVDSGVPLDPPIHGSGYVFHGSNLTEDELDRVTHLMRRVMRR